VGYNANVVSKQSGERGAKSYKSSLPSLGRPPSICRSFIQSKPEESIQLDGYCLDGNMHGAFLEDNHVGSGGWSTDWA
jgi:hypothetical protein